MAWRIHLHSNWQRYAWFAISTYRWLAISVAACQIFIFNLAQYSLIRPGVLLATVSAYTLALTFFPPRWYRETALAFWLIGADVALCLFLVLSTDGLYSPYLLYTLCPVLTAALFMPSKVTTSVSVLSGIYIILSHVFNPFFPTRLTGLELVYFWIYMTAIALTAALPYLINVNLRQRLQSEYTLGERQRLSREFHDGSVQTLSALCWQAQLLSRRLTQMGVDLEETRKLKELAEKARQETLHALQILRTPANGSFMVRLRDSLEQNNHNNNVTFHIDADNEKLQFDTLVEHELLRICQEAATNIRKHSRANNALITIRAINSHVAVRIADDGCGFDAVAHYHNRSNGGEGHGLAVMRERAELVGGKLRVLSMPGRGTEIQVEVPSANNGGKSWHKQ